MPVFKGLGGLEGILMKQTSPEMPDFMHWAAGVIIRWQKDNGDGSCLVSFIAEDLETSFNQGYALGQREGVASTVRKLL